MEIYEAIYTKQKKMLVQRLPMFILHDFQLLALVCYDETLCT